MSELRAQSIFSAPFKYTHIGLRIGASAVIAYALAYRNAAFAGQQTTDPNSGRLPPTVYSAPAADACAQGAEDARCISVLVDHLRRVGLPEPVRTVLIGNPAIAEVTMISETQAVVSARTIGSTNLIFLNDDGEAIGDFQVLVREGEQRRVVLRRGPTSTELYQCAPRCERTLTQLDSPEAHQAVTEQITRETSVNQNAANEGAQQ